MPELLLIIGPLGALAVVLVLGFAGCDFNPREAVPELTLTFRANVPATLTVPSGVTFGFTRPGGTPETETVTGFTTGDPNNVYDLPIDEPEPGSWLGRCEMAVQEDGQSADGSSGDFAFELSDAVQDNVLLFETEGSPLAPPFRVLVRGLTQV